MTILDAHAHLWQRARTPQDWIDPASMPAIDRDFWVDDLIALQSAAGIDGTILVQSVNTAQETLDLLAAASHPSVVGVVGWIELEGDVAGQLASLRALPGGEKLVGIRHLAHVDPDPSWLTRPTVDLDALDVPFDLVVHAPQLKSAAAAAAAHPSVTFVLDHLGNPPIASSDLAAWRRDLALLAELPNVVTKLSGITLQTNWSDWTIDDLRGSVEYALDLFGAQRLLFGTDWPLLLLASKAPSWIEIVRELIPTEHHAAVLGGNAARVYLGDQHA
ncbi:amidohydrolase [Glaciihabitans arcticus]|uniref:Amidohydrolase n=1 Tax=Glaciihabitans arcticus TaxID=2668039 RepID=A0A4Q9GVQ5_9MICO|nr:amidohydrolase family protein [Glaciihabitans arcticus]TBN57678.1 amidohydrolase [Glaciihabitans arcticus]